MTNAVATAGAPARALGALTRGRAVVLAVLYGYFLALIAGGGHDRWDRFWVPDLQPPFFDLRSVTSAWECTRKGVEVLASNPCDPWGRPANYPRLWLVPSGLGLGQGSTIALGLAVAIVFFASFLLLIRPATAAEGLLYGAALVSPAVMLGVERANPDLLLFPLLVAAVLLFRRPGWAKAVAHGLLLLAAMLKLFPAFAFGLLVRQPRRLRLLGGGAVVGAFAVYALATLSDIRTILKVVPKEVWYSYGAGVGPEAVRNWLAHDVSGSFANETFGRIVTAILVAAALALATLLAARLRPAPGGAAPSSIPLDAFVVGATIYAGSFAVMHNWDYRLVFLLLTLPQLVAWARAGEGDVPAPRLTLAAVLATLWLGEYLSIRNPAAPLEELLNWLVFVTFSAALLRLLAPSLLDRVARMRAQAPA